MSFYNERKLNYLLLLIELMIRYSWISALILALAMFLTKPKYAAVYLCIYSPLTIMYQSKYMIWVIIQWLALLAYVLYQKNHSSQ